VKGAKMTTKSDAAVAKNDVTEPAPFDPNQSWEVNTRDADKVLGHDLAKEEILDALVGVPFLITRLTFREADTIARGSYVSCEAQLAPKAEMERRRVDLTKLPFDPGELVVFNDGSTGVYRQMVAYLQAKGFITLPDPISANGDGPRWDDKQKKVIYACTYDLPPEEWSGVNAGEMRYTPSGKGEYTVNVRILAKRGIRISEYENDWTKDGKTRYLA
jgi:hypothetical protein